jgi:arylsulfatase A-like enzyme/Tfp pilus assembly protein PilF
MSSSRKSASPSRPSTRAGARKVSGNAGTSGPGPGLRRPWLIVAGLVTIAAVVAGAWWVLGRARGGPGPLILISIDTLRADRLPAYGYTKVQTPAIDGLARDGVLFERAYAHSPQTLPSHAAILSGQLPFENGVRDNVGFTLRPDQPTLASLVRKGGYASGGFVSAFVLRKETGIGGGFDAFDDQLPPSAPDVPMGQVQRSGPETLKAAERWMSGLASPKFFLFLHIYEPHTPYTPPERFSQYAPYDGEIAFSDEVVGQLVAWLKGRGLYDRATIIFLSDHGEGLGDHGELEHGLFVYDSTIRVPLIVKMPGSAGAGRRVKEPVQHIDLVPTVLDWLGLSGPKGLRGRSLRPLLEGGPALDNASVYAEAFYGRYHFGWSELYSLTDARYRFIKAPKPEVYDLDRDPGETRNLAAERPQVVASARAELDRMLAGASIQAPSQVSKEDLERLQALGYVGSQASVPPDRQGESLPDPKDKAKVLESYRRAIALAASRDYDESIRLLGEVLADSPSMKDGWIQLGVELVRSGRNLEAVGAFKRLVELDPSDANSFISIAGVYQTLGKLPEAQANAEIGLEKAGDVRTRTSACEVLVKIALARKDVAAARRYATTAQQASPEFPLPDYVEGLISHGEKRFEEALPRFQAAIARLQGQQVTIPELFFYAGDTLANLGRAEEAVAAFKQELEFSPTHLRTRTSLAMLYRADGRYADAAREIDEMTTAVPTPEGYAMAAKTWAIFGESARAEAVRAAAAARFSKAGRGTKDEGRGK